MDTRTIRAPEGDAARIPHEPDHGFCAVCGAVWPCWRAAKALAGRPEPVLVTRAVRTVRTVRTAA